MANDGGEGPFDDARDEIALSMVDRMIDAQKPVFGICRGFQEINVALGGTLRRDTSASADLIRHHAPDGVSVRCDVQPSPPGRTGRGRDACCAYAKPAMDVNSVHYQGIGKLAEGLCGRGPRARRLDRSL